MKKRDLLTGIVYSLLGLGCLSLALTHPGKPASVLWGLTGALIGPGVVMIWRYCYWSRPQNRQQYQDRLDAEAIERNDELKRHIRDRSGRYAYVLGLLVISVSMVAFSLLEAFGVIRETRMIVLFLGAYLVFQIAAGILLFNHILKRY